MSSGSKPYTFRLPDDLIREMEEAIKSRNARSAEEPWTWSGFVRDAIKAKLAHRERGKRQRRRVNDSVADFIEEAIAQAEEGGVA